MAHGSVKPQVQSEHELYNGNIGNYKILFIFTFFKFISMYLFLCSLFSTIAALNAALKNFWKAKCRRRRDPDPLTMVAYVILNWDKMTNGNKYIVGLLK